MKTQIPPFETPEKIVDWYIKSKINVFIKGKNKRFFDNK
jgi:hypothetical protein